MSAYFGDEKQDLLGKSVFRSMFRTGNASGYSLGLGRAGRNFGTGIFWVVGVLDRGVFQ